MSFHNRTQKKTSLICFYPDRTYLTYHGKIGSFGEHNTVCIDNTEYKLPALYNPLN